MFFHKMKSRDIRVNLATESYLMNQKLNSEPLFLMYIQKPCIIVGKHQNIYDEVNLEAAHADHITLTRRLSGGGAVYDDLGNISFSFVVDKKLARFGDYTSMVESIVKALKEMGVQDVSVNGRNDILIDGKKISGNAMYTKNNRMFSHGTLLYDVDLDKLPIYLNVSEEKLASKHIQSVASRVTNIKPYLDEPFRSLSTEAFQDELLKRIYQVNELSEVESKEIQLTDKDQQEIEQLVSEIYGNDEWIYGHHQPFTNKKRAYLPSVGLLEARFQLSDGNIHFIDFLGDFFNQSDLIFLRQILEGISYAPSAVEEALRKVEVSDYFANLTNEQFVDFLVGDDAGD